jgi:protein involved in polysaccharide export with SLBB domain
MIRWSSSSEIIVLSLIVLSVAIPVAAQNALAPSLTGRGYNSAGSNEPRATYLETDPGIHKRSWRYRLNPSDTLELTFTLTPEFNQTLTIQPDGYITLRGVGDLPAAGCTLPELTQAIKAAFAKILHDPQISVDLKDFEKPFFIVGGQVGKPGKFDWHGDVTLTQAIAMAGGFTDASKHSQVLLFQRVSDQWTEARIINVKKMLSSRDLQEDPVLQPGDMLFVPKNSISKIKPFLPTTSAGVYANPPIF